ncbi:hypothetical protein [Methanobrevibacter sp.]|uniref:hypothetical protein n=1 Tax=Methanobrevibacter sp. TaxID=66852 RepID=UPI00386A4426
MLVCLALLVFVASATFVAATADVNTPDRYKINDNLTIDKQQGELQGKAAIVTSVVMENGTDNITLTTFTVDGDVELSTDAGGQKKTINGKEGIYQEKDGRSLFLYKVGEQFVNINAPNEKL